MAEATTCSNSGAQESQVSHCFPIYLPWRDGTISHDLCFLNVEFQASFFTLLFHFHQEALQFLFAFCRKDGSNCSNCCFLTRTQVSQEACKVVWYSHILKNFPQFVVIHTVKGFSVVVNEADVSVEFSCFFYDPMDVGHLISGSSAFSKYSLNIWKFIVHVLLKPRVEIFEHYFASMWHECNCAVVWTFFGIAFLWDWKLTFSSPVATAELYKFAGILSAAPSQHHLLGFEIAQLEYITSNSFACSEAS